MSNSNGSSTSAPVITAASGQDIGSLKEDTILKASGQLIATETGNSRYNDFDWAVVGNGRGTYGTLTIDQNGKWTYNLNNSSSSVQALAQGEAVTETFTVQVKDDHGKIDTHTITVNVAGTNDAPVFSCSSTDTTGTVQEDATLSATGKLSVTDVDHGAALSYSVIGGTAAYGSLTVDQTGKWVYVLNNSAANVQALAKNEQVTETFTIQVKDQFGATDTQVVTVRVVGSNDAPTVAGTSTGTVKEDGTSTATGQLTASDVDHNAQLSWSIVDNSGTYGNLSINSSGKWTFTLNNSSSAVQGLAAGQTATDSFSVQVKDQYGTTTTQIVNIQVQGSNDAPVITSAVTTGSVREDSTLSATGQITATDIDHDTLAWSVANPAGTYGSLSVDQNGKWTYTLNNGAANVQALAQGETVQETFTVKVADPSGVTLTKTITVNVAGTNDGPVLSTPIADQVVLAQAPFSFATASNFTDVDHGAVVRYSATLADGSPLPSWLSINSTTGVVSGTPPATINLGTLNTVTFKSESADYHNTLGAYQIDANGNITGVKLLFGNASAQGSGGSLQSGVSQASITADPGKTVGYFLIADGFDVNSSFSRLDLVNGHLEFRNSNGSQATLASKVPDLWYVGPNGQQIELSGTIFHSAANNGSNMSLNADKLDHVKETTANGQTTYAFEDLSKGGDKDYNDLIVSVAQTPITTDHISIKVTATDQYGVSASDTLDINLDRPPVANADVAATTENQSVTIDVLANDTDPDPGAVLTVSAASVPAGQGAVSIVNNKVVFNPGTNFDHLAPGATAIVTIQYTIKDNFGVAASSTAKVTVTGTNDAPVVTSGTQAGAAQEDSIVTASGQFSATDVDDGAQLTWSVVDSANGGYGTLAVAAGGQWTYTLANGSAAVQSLSAGESHADVFTVQVSDGQGGVATRQVTINVTGSNDGPVVTSSVQAGLVQEDSTLSVTGQVTASDVDHLDVLSYAVQGSAQGTYGALSVNSSTGQWTYNLANGSAAVQGLSAGEVHNETFTVQVSDGHGGTTSQQVTVTVVGTNDGPVVTSAAQTGTVKEDVVATASGQVTASDVDHLDTLSYALQGNGQGDYGSLSLDGVTGQWTYSLDNNAANVQELSAGESHVEVFTVEVSDGQGGTSTQQVSVTVTGTNDAPTVTSSPQSGAVQEDSSLAVSGLVTAWDIDHLDSLSFAVQGSGQGAYGSLSVDSATGLWTYNLANGSAAVQDLSAGETHVETFTVQVSDGQGGTSTQQVSVTVYGTNDAPVVTSGDQTGSVQEDSVLTATGQVTASDIDHLDTLSYAVQGSSQGTYGSLSIDSVTGQWTYSFDNGSAAVQNLSAGESHVETFTVEVSDGQGTSTQQVSVTVTGTNDAPVVTSSPQSGAVQEDMALAVSGLVTASDIDHLDSLSFAVQGDGQGTYGSLSVDGVSGFWTYNLANGSAAVQGLSAGESHVETFTVEVSDGQGGTSTQQVSVTVYGTNDTPVVTSGTQTGSVQEDSVLAATGQVTASDVDHLDSLSFAIQGDGQGIYGSLAVDSVTGQWTYSLANGSAAVQDLSAGESHEEVFTVEFSDGQGGTSTQQVSVTVTGTNDAPTVTSGDQTGSAQEDSLLVAIGQVTASDIDHLDSLSYFVQGDGQGIYGSLSVDSVTGQWTYNLANGSTAVQDLSAGESHVEVFTVQISDGQGGTSTQQVSLTVTGTNDEPVITSGVQTGDAQEDTVLTVTGQVTASDIDHLDTLSYTVTAIADSKFPGVGAYGALTVDATTGAWTYTLDNEGGAVQSLSAGETAIDTFTIEVRDGQGGFTSQQVSITVTGTNDAPIMTSGDQTGDVQEDTVLTVAGQMAASDSDHLDTLNYSVAAIADSKFPGVGAYGALTVDAGSGAWTYALANESGAVQQLSAGETAIDTFTVQVSDGQGGISSQQVSITVTGTNDGPIISSETQTGAVQEDTVFAASGQVTAFDIDHLDTLAYALQGSGQGAYGELSVDATTGAWTYALANNSATVQALAAGESHVEVFTVEVSDDQGGTSTQQVSITITGTNDGPVAVADSAAGTENQSLTIDVLANDTDVDNGYVLTLASVSVAAGQGSVSVVNNKLVFNPGTDFDHLTQGATQTVAVSYTIQDEFSATSSSTATITVTGTNDAPVAVADSAAGTENQTLTIDVLANDTDVDDGHVLTLTSVSVPAGQGSVSIVGNKLVFNPGTDFDHLGLTGSQHVFVSYTVQDEFGSTSSSTVTVAVFGSNDRPVAVLDTASTDENQSLTVDVLANDTDVDDGHVLTLTSVSLPAGQGSASIVGNKLVFNPGTDFDHLAQGATQTITVGYTVADEFNSQSASAVTITVIGTNDAPVAVADSAAGTENQTLTIDVLANDTDVDDGHVLTLTSVSVPAGQGSVSIVGNKLVFNPGTDFDHLGLTGSQHVFVSYTVQDEFGSTSSSTVTVAVFGSNDRPVAVLDTASTDENQSLTVDVLANDTDVDDSYVFTLTSVSVASGQGSVSISGNKLVFNPGTDFDHLAQGASQTITVFYTMEDEWHSQSSSSVSITVTGTNDAPVANHDADMGHENETITLFVLANDTDVDDGRVLTLTNASVAPGQGTVSIVNNNIVFNPGSDFDHLAQGAGQLVVVNYTIQDQFGATSSTFDNVIVLGTNDAPVARADTASTTENSATTVDVLANDTDADDNYVLTLTAASVGAGQGSVSIVANKIVFNPGTDFDHLAQGAAQNVAVSYTVSDQFGATSTATATITVTGTNDAPIANADSTGTSENVSITVDVLANDTDIDDGHVFTLTSVSGSAGQGAVSIVGNKLFFNPGTDFDHLTQGVAQTLIVSYTMRDEFGATSSSTATLTVTGTNDAPVANADTASTTENASITIDVLVNDTDADDGGVLTLAAASVVGGQGSVSIVANKVVFNPGTDFDHLAQGATQNVVVSYTVSDELGAASTATATITVTGTNDGPVAVVDTGAVGSTSTLTLDVLANDTDVDDDRVLTLTSVSVPAGQGTVSIVNNRVVFDPTVAFATLAFGATQNVVVSYTMKDEFGATSNSTVTITVTGANHPPVANTDIASTTENASVTVNVLANDTDTDAGSTLSITAASVAGGQGSVSIVSNKIVFNPGTDFDHLAQGVTQNVVVNYTITDEKGATSSSTATITVTGTNDAPIAQPDTASGTENQTLTLDVLANDTDADDNHTFTFVSASVASGGGSVSISGSNLVYNPGTSQDHLAQGATQTVVINYTMLDQFGSTSSSTETLTITGTNDGPVAVADKAGTTENATLIVDVLANDTDVDDGHVFTLTGASITSGGGFISIVNNKLVFGPGTVFNDMLQGATRDVVVDYTMRDEFGATSASTATITVTGVNDAPIAAPHSYAANNTQVLAVSAANGLLQGASDPDTGDSVFLTTVGSVTTSLGATVTIGADGAFAYNDVFGSIPFGSKVTDTFSYTVIDTAGATSTAIATFTVTGTNNNHVPVAKQDTGKITEGLQATIGTVLTNDSDVDGDSLTVVATNLTGTYGNLTLSANGSYVYNLNNGNAALLALNAGQTAVDTFSYSISDGHGGTSTSQIAITVTGVNNLSNTSLSGSLIYGMDFTYTTTGGAVRTALTNGLGGTSGFGTHFLGDASLQLFGSSTTAQGNGQLDDSYSFIDLSTAGVGGKPITIPFFGNNYTGFFLDSNGLISFTAGVTTWVGQHFPISPTIGPLIAPFFGDVDTRHNGTTTVTTPGGNSTGSDRIWYDVDAKSGVITITWDDVGVYNFNDTTPNAFQLQLVPTAGAGGSGSYQAFFRYETIQWTVGEAGGPPGQVGFDAGDGIHFFDVPVSQTSAVTTLPTLSNTIPPLAGTFQFGISNNVITQAVGLQTITTSVLNGTTGNTIVAVNGIDTSVDTTIVLPSGAQLLMMPNGTYTYSYPNTVAFQTAQALGQAITDSFTYTVKASDGTTKVATAFVDVLPAAVKLGADTVSVVKNGSAGVGNLLVNDLDPTPATALQLDTPTGTVMHAITGAGTFAGDFGTLTVSANGGYSYTINKTNSSVVNLGDAATLTDTFSYSTTETSANSTLTVTIRAAEHAPTVVSDTASVDTFHTVVIGNLLTNDKSNDVGQSMIVTGTMHQTGLYGSIDFNADGSYSYTLDKTSPTVQSLVAGQVLDTFQYQATDGVSTSTASVSVAYTATTLATKAGDDTITVKAGGTVYGFDSTPYLSQFKGGAGGQGTTVLANTDDGSTLIDLSTLGPNGSSINFNIYGQLYNQIYIDSNGAVSFTSGINAWQGLSMPLSPGRGPMISPFFADTNVKSGGNISYNVDNSGIFTVTWDAVRPFGSGTATDTFQLQLVNRSDGHTDALFRYGAIGWTQASSMVVGPFFASAGVDAGDGLHAVRVPDSNLASIANLATLTNIGAAGVQAFDATDLSTSLADLGAGSVKGSLLANDTGATAVTAINGVAASVDHTVTLASGALLTVYADGQYVYRTGTAFNDLASNQTATDSFTYTYSTASGTSTANVVVTVQGTGSGQVVRGTLNNDVLAGTTGDDTFFGGAGNDILVGGGGHDLFVFAHGDGQDMVTDFSTSPATAALTSDIVDVTNYHFTSFADLMTHQTMPNGSSNTVFDFGNGDKLTLLGVDPQNLTAAHFYI